MYVRMKIGRYAGEIQDVRPDVARDLISSGRGEDPFAAPKVAPLAPAAAPETKAAIAETMPLKIETPAQQTRNILAARRRQNRQS